MEIKMFMDFSFTQKKWIVRLEALKKLCIIIILINEKKIIALIAAEKNSKKNSK